MPYGYNGKILRVNLSNKSIGTEEFDEAFYRTYMGGSGLIAYYLLKELKPKVDPLSPDNILVFASGALTGARVGGMCRYAVGAKSPLTGGFGESEAGGFWGPELKMSGFDAIVIEGKAEKPVYLYVKDGSAEIRDASHLWGKTTGETQEAIRNELGDSRVKLAQIGPAGEKMVRFACVTNNLKHFNGRNGLGAVMGSKNLKAVAVRGTKDVPAADPAALSEIARRFAKAVPENPLTKGLYQWGTAAAVTGNSAIGILPTKNFHYGEFDKAENISAARMVDTILVAREGCYACPVRCKRVVRSEEHGIDPAYGGPEYETLAALGSLCMIDDLNAVALGNQICNQYTMDTISAGMVIAWAMECFEAGILTKCDTDGIELTFGNAQAMLQMLEKIGKREGFGDILAEGSVRAAQKIGRGSEKFVLAVKGQELPMHDARGKYAVGLGYATCERGADHMVVGHDTMLNTESYSFVNTMPPMGVYSPTSATEYSPLKVRTFAYLSYWWSFFNEAGICQFVPVPRSAMPISDVLGALKAYTGWNTSLWEVMKAGERGITMARVFNLREGFSASDDKFPERLHQPLENGAMKGAFVPKEDLNKAIKLYYGMMGWDENGIPTEEKLLELGLDWLVQK